MHTFFKRLDAWEAMSDLRDSLRDGNRRHVALRLPPTTPRDDEVRSLFVCSCSCMQSEVHALFDLPFGEAWEGRLAGFFGVETLLESITYAHAIAPLEGIVLLGHGECFILGSLDPDRAASAHPLEELPSPYACSRGPDPEVAREHIRDAARRIETALEERSLEIPVLRALLDDETEEVRFL